MPLITFEGTEGMGKSTQLIRLANYLHSAGHTVVRTRQPGGTQLGAKLRETLLDPSLRPVPLAELFLYLADRAQHVQEFLQPELDAGHWVLCDRYSDATIAYQGGGRELPEEQLLRINRWATHGLVPDLTFVFDGDPAVGLERARGRSLLDRMEQEEVAFFAKVRQRYLQLAAEEPVRFVVIDALTNEDEVWQQVQGGFHKRLGGSVARTP